MTVGRRGLSGMVLGALAGVCALAAASTTWAAPDITAGPIVGHVSEHGARVWLQLPVAKQVSVECYDVADDREVAAVSMDVAGPTPFTADVPVNNLEPGKTYRVEFKLDNVPVHIPGPPTLIRTAPATGTEASMTIGFGSGVDAHGAGTAPIFNVINSVKPRAFLFLGDTTFLPRKMPSFEVDGYRDGRRAYRFIADRYSATRREPDLQMLFRTTPCYAVWNDRDYGPPHANRTWPFTAESWYAFQRFWPNPDWGTPKDHGCYCTFTMGDVDFFLLDGRSHRDPAATKPGQPRTMLGEPQLEWLKEGLLNSQATFKVIGCGCPLLTSEAGQAGTDGGAPEQGWTAFQPEQRDFLEWLGTQHISGVIFVSGNSSGFGALTAVPASTSPTGYPLLELTSSSLATSGTNATAGSLPSPALPATTNPASVSAPVTDNNFGTLDFAGEREHRFVTLRLRDELGKIRVEQTVFASQLRR